METERHIQTTYRLTYAERLRASWELTANAPTVLLPLCIFPAMGAILLWTTSLPTSRNTAWDYVLALACFAFVPFMILWNAFRAHRANRNKGPYHYRFDSLGIHVTTATSELTHRWPAIMRTRKTRRMFYLYFTRRCAHCVPLRALPTGGATEEIEQLASAGGAFRAGA